MASLQASACCAAMVLNARSFGDEGKPPLAIVHGLLGSSRNWQAMAKRLGERYWTHALDLRNHGDSPHAEPHSYEAMAQDLLAWMDGLGLERMMLMGHSMGGKLAMKLACENPRRIRKLIVVDIAPRVYPNSHEKDLAAMLAIDTRRLESRKQADDALADAVPDWALRQFLLTNLVKREEGGYRWSANLRAIYEGRRHLESSSLRENQRFDGEALFVVGSDSKYVRREDFDRIRHHFPASAVERIEDCGHNPHFERPDAFSTILFDFCG